MPTATVVNWASVRYHMWNAVRADDPKRMKAVLLQTTRTLGDGAGVRDALAALQTHMWRENNSVDRTGRPRGGVLVVAAANGATNCLRALVHLPQPTGELENAMVRTQETHAASGPATAALSILAEAARADWRSGTPVCNPVT